MVVSGFDLPSDAIGDEFPRLRLCTTARSAKEPAIILALRWGCAVGFKGFFEPASRAVVPDRGRPLPSVFLDIGGQLSISRGGYQADLCRYRVPHYSRRNDLRMPALRRQGKPERCDVLPTRELRPDYFRRRLR